MNRQTIELPNTLSRTYVVHNLKRPLTERFKTRKVCGPYVCTRMTADSNVFLYLDSYGDCGDGPIALRVFPCHESEEVRINHTGWYTDDDGMKDTIYGIVARLPHGRGFLAGWSMGAGMATSLEREVYDSESSACHAADSIAERTAEREREYQHGQDIELDIDQLSSDIVDTRREYSELANELRGYQTERHQAAGDYPVICQTLRGQLSRLREVVRDSVREIREKREELNLING